MSELFLSSNFYIVASKVAEILHDRQRGKKALYITTAAEVEEGDKVWLDEDRNSLKEMGLEVQDYTLTGKTTEDFKKDFTDIYYVLVSGGNTFYLLEQAQKSGFIPFISEYVKRTDTVYFGSSAGAAIAGSDIYALRALDDPKDAPHLQGTEGFNFLDLCLFPHWGSENFKKKYTTNWLDDAYNEKYKSIMLTNNQFLYVDQNGDYKLLEI